MLTISNNPTRKGLSVFRPNVIKFLGFNPGACPWDEAKKYFSKSLICLLYTSIRLSVGAVISLPALMMWQLLCAHSVTRFPGL